MLCTRMALLLLLLFSFPAMAQFVPRPHQFVEADGFPSPDARGIAQDRQGYIWLGTMEGLVRYDGHDFKTWPKPEGMADPIFRAIFIDPQDRIWITTRDAGILVLDENREHYRYLRKEHPDLTTATIWIIAFARDGATWVGAMDGLQRLDRDGTLSRFHPVPGDERSVPANFIPFMAETADGTFWLASEDAVARWTGHDFERLVLPMPTAPRITYLAAEDDGSLIIASDKAIFRRHLDGRLEIDTDSGVPVGEQYETVERGSDGNYWAFRFDGGIEYGRHGTMNDVPMFSTASQGRVRPTVFGRLNDREGGLWLGTMLDGLWYLPGNWNRFPLMARSPLDLDNAPQIYAFSRSARGGLWMAGTHDGLDYIAPDGGKTTRLFSGLMEAGESVYEDARGYLWVGPSEAGLIRLDPRSGAKKVWKRTLNGDPMLARAISDITQTADGTLWLHSSTSNILQARDGEGNVLKTLRAGEVEGFGADTRIVQIGAGADGALWLASNVGLMRWDGRGTRLAPIAGVAETSVASFRVVSADEIWVGTQGRLEKFRWRDGALEPLIQVDATRGFPDMLPNGIEVDSDGNVWATSKNGLIRVDPAGSSVRLYSVHDGMPGQHFFMHSLLALADGKLLASSPVGVMMFNPRLLQSTSPQKPNLVIESVSLRRVRQQGLHAVPAGPLIIAHDDHELKVVARLLSFSSPRTHEYRFHLGGYDNDWVSAGNAGERVFSQLPPGNYELRVQARMQGGAWSDSASMNFKVLPPWWLSQWGIALFVLLGALLLLTAAWLCKTWLERRSAWRLAQHRQQLAEQASEAKTRFLATLGHEVRTPMTGVLGMSELLLATPLDGRQQGYIRSIRSAGSHLLRLVNDALDLARIEAGRLDLTMEPFDLQELLGEVVALTAPIAQGKQLDFVEENTFTGPVTVLGDAMRIRQILLNLLGNAVKFTERGKVTLRASPGETQGLRLEVEDTGPGINAEQRQRLFQRFEQGGNGQTAAHYGGSGLGLAICQELVAAMGGRIRVDSVPERGSRFTVELPLEVSVGVSAPPKPARAEPSPQREVTALLVEDDPTVAEVITGLLQMRGHKVRHVPHGLAALAEAQTTHYDVALLDLDLPGMDGIALARQLRASGHSMPLVAITARADADAEPQALAAGIDGFLRKPVTGTMLATEIARVLQRD